MSCSTIDVLRDVHAASDSAIIKAHVQAAMDSHVTPLPVFRTLGDFSKTLETKAVHSGTTVPYAEIVKMRELDRLTSVNCHNGQKKLAMSVLEFVAVAIANLKCAQSELLIVYAGASGLSSVIALTVFKELQMVLYDPAANTVSLMPPFADKVVYTRKEDGEAEPDMSKRLLVYTAKAGWFDDAAARKWSLIGPKTQQRKHVLFISDIRVKATEPAIVQDMLNQERWALLIGSSMYMFKFRLPYHFDAAVERAYGDMAHLEATGRTLILPTGHSKGQPTGHPTGHTKGKQFSYLDGDLYIQLYGRQMTAEVRMIGARDKSTQAYKMRSYDIADIEDKLALFNSIYRSHAKFSYANYKIAQPSYEAVAEYAILSKCCRALGSRTKESQVLMLTDVNALLAKFISKDSVSCPLKTAEKLKVARMDDATRAYLLGCIDRIEASNPTELPRDLIRNLREKLGTTRKNKTHRTRVKTHKTQKTLSKTQKTHKTLSNTHKTQKTRKTPETHKTLSKTHKTQKTRKTPETHKTLSKTHKTQKTRKTPETHKTLSKSHKSQKTRKTPETHKTLSKTHKTHKTRKTPETHKTLSKTHKTHKTHKIHKTHKTLGERDVLLFT